MYWRNLVICFISTCKFTGGPLAIHQAASKVKAHGGDAGILYTKNGKPHMAFDLCDGRIVSKISFLGRFKINGQLKAFGFPTRVSFSREDHFIVPEIFPDLAYRLLRLGCKNVSLWWLSVDNFPLSNLQTLQNQRLMRECKHLCQSEYAADFVRRHGASSVSMLSDEIDFHTNETLPPVSKRTNDLCFLPNKSAGADELLEHLSQEFSIVRLENMSRSQITETLLDTRIFLDFGHHPGKDRVPREAALCGAIPVVRAEGAARFEQDVPLPKELLIESRAFFDGPEFISRLQNILNSAEQFNDALSQYRAKIASEKQTFDSEIQALIQNSIGEVVKG
jgi:hypothetical protein|tara:strand:- start:492 stop:1499 length:1008 start_codon:yes stop_codon:yes gene_type:complete